MRANSIEGRVQSLVSWLGKIPSAARLVQNHELRWFAGSRLRQGSGHGIVQSYTFGYELGDRWWTLCFERVFSTARDGAEQWWVEAYEKNGKSWSGHYYYLPAEGRWRGTPEPIQSFR